MSSRRSSQEQERIRSRPYPFSVLNFRWKENLTTTPDSYLRARLLNFFLK